MAKRPARRKKPVAKRKSIANDADRLTDKYGRLKFLKNSDYLNMITKGEG